MIGRSSLLTSLRREALPLTVLAVLALLLQGFIAPLSASLAATGEQSPFVLCVAVPDGPTVAVVPGSDTDHRSGSCPCGPVCPHASACSSARAVLSSGGHLFDLVIAQSSVEWLQLALHVDARFWPGAQVIRGPPTA